MDPGTGLTVLGSAVGGAKVVEKLLGPTADYLGEGLRSWTQRRMANTASVFRKAAAMLGERLNHPGRVHPRVLDRILIEAPVTEDDLAANYLAGVLAASRTEEPRDDRGAALVSLVGRLTTYQIHAHFIFYHTIRDLYLGLDLIPTSPKDRSRSMTFLPLQGLHEVDQDIISHVTWGLFRETLIADGFRTGNAEHLREKFPNAPGEGIVFKPALQGAELFLWAHGLRDTNPRALLNEATQLPSLAPFERIPDACHVSPEDVASPKRAVSG